MYEIQFSTAAQRYFKKLRDKKLKNAFYEALHKISENPYTGIQKSGDLATVYGYDVHYNGVNYELAYLISETGGKMIIILLAGTRENFYEELKRMYRK
ncbi:MAG: type II toxin-antitoxin system RelE/ParE family toxin [Cyanobacteria bacterium]|nr:type II toxin-antitoxin system RelE/ParE family toxin [Cyanobacteriota bacterium]